MQSSGRRRCEGELEKKGFKTATLLIGTGPEEDQKKYFQMARDLGLKHTYFLGPHQQSVLAKLYTIASVCVFPSFKEPFGMVFVESMACGSPVIGANSGGPKDFVSPEVGELVDEPAEDQHDLKIPEITKNLTDAVVRAIVEDWKASKGPNAHKLAVEKYSTLRQCTDLLTAADAIIAQRKK